MHSTHHDQNQAQKNISENELKFVMYPQFILDARLSDKAKILYLYLCSNKDDYRPGGQAKIADLLGWKSKRHVGLAAKELEFYGLISILEEDVLGSCKRRHIYEINPASDWVGLTLNNSRSEKESLCQSATEEIDPAKKAEFEISAKKIRANHHRKSTGPESDPEGSRLKTGPESVPGTGPESDLGTGPESVPDPGPESVPGTGPESDLYTIPGHDTSQIRDKTSLLERKESQIPSPPLDSKPKKHGQEKPKSTPKVNLETLSGSLEQIFCYSSREVRRSFIHECMKRNATLEDIEDMISRIRNYMLGKDTQWQARWDRKHGRLDARIQEAVIKEFLIVKQKEAV